MAIKSTNYLFNPNVEPKKNDPIVKVNNLTIGTLGNVITISGRSGVRKSTFLHAFIGSYLANKRIFDLKINNPFHPDERKKIILLDTEQSEYSLYNQFLRLRKQIKTEKIDNKVLIYRLRTLDAESIKKFIHSVLIEHPDTFLLCIDNILDLVMDYNNIAEAKLLMDFFKQLTENYNILLFAVIHQSKQSAFSIGHVGSRLEALAQTSLRVEYKNREDNKEDKEISILRVGEKIRDSEEFEKIGIVFNKSLGIYEKTNFL